MDNLQSMTYQTFEQDPVKYRNYEEVMESFSTPHSILRTLSIAMFLTASLFRPSFAHYQNGPSLSGCTCLFPASLPDFVNPKRNVPY